MTVRGSAAAVSVLASPLVSARNIFSMHTTPRSYSGRTDTALTAGAAALGQGHGIQGHHAILLTSGAHATPPCLPQTRQEGMGFPHEGSS